MKKYLAIFTLAIMAAFIAGCGNVDSSSAMKTTIETYGTAAETSLTNGISSDTAIVKSDITSGQIEIGTVYTAATPNSFKYLFGIDDKTVYAKTAYYANIEDAKVGCDAVVTRIETAGDAHNATRWMAVKNLLVIQKYLVKGEACPTDKKMTRDISPKIVMPLNQLKPYLQGLAKDKVKAMALNNVRASRDVNARDIDWSALSEQAVEALQSGMSAIWEYIINNSTNLISISETELTELITALSNKNTLEAKQLLVSAMDEDGLNEYLSLVQAEGKVLAADNAAYITKCNGLWSGGLTAGLTAMTAIIFGN